MAAELTYCVTYIPTRFCWYFLAELLSFVENCKCRALTTFWSSIWWCRTTREVLFAKGWFSNFVSVVMLPKFCKFGLNCLFLLPKSRLRGWPLVIESPKSCFLTWKRVLSPLLVVITPVVWPGCDANSTKVSRKNLKFDNMGAVCSTMETI